MEQPLTHAAEALLVVALLLAPWAYGGAPDVARYALTALILLAAGLWMAARAARGAGLPPLAPAATGLPLLALVQVVSGMSAAPVWTLEAFLVLTAMMTVVVFWSERARERPAALRAAAAVLFTCAAQAAFGAVQWSVAPDRVYGQASPFMTTPFGSYVNHNHFAGLIGMGVVLSAAMALGHARRGGGLTPASLALGGLSLALGAVHLASRSRGGLLGLAAGLGVMALVWAGFASRSGSDAGRRLAVAAVLAILVLGFGIAAIPGSSREHLATLLEGPADTSGTYRMDVAAGTLRLAAAHPLAGSGLGAYADAFPAYKRGDGDMRTTHAESDVLEFLAEGGLAGIALAGWLAWGLGKGFSDRLAHGRDPFRKAIAVGAFSAAAGLTVHSLVDFNLRLPANALVFATLLGIGGAPRTEPPPPARSRLGPILAAAALVALAVAAGWRGIGGHALDRALSTPPGARPGPRAPPLPGGRMASARRGLARAGVGSSERRSPPRLGTGGPPTHHRAPAPMG